MKSLAKIATPAAVPPLAVVSAGDQMDLHPLFLAHAEAPATAAWLTQVSCAKTTCALVPSRRRLSAVHPVGFTVSTVSWKSSCLWRRSALAWCPGARKATSPPFPGLGYCTEASVGRIRIR